MTLFSFFSLRHLNNIPPSLVEVLQILVRPLVVLVVQLDEQLIDSDPPEDHLGVADDVLLVGVGGDLELEAARVEVGAERPEVRFLDTLHTL